MFKRCVWEVSMVCNKFSKKFQGSFKKVSRVFQDSFKDVSRKIEGRFKEDFSGFQWYLKEVQRNFFREISKVFQGSLKSSC